MGKRRRKQVDPLAAARRRSHGLVWLTLGWLLRLATVGLIYYIVENDTTILLVVPPMALAALFVRMGKKMRATSADTLLRDDTRPPVLYLRSFQDEDADKGVAGVSRSVRGDPKQLAHSTPAWGPREQEAIAAVFKEIGPYVAIGKPKEKLPELGAARMYVADSKWQKRVTDLCMQSKLVIVRAGLTTGLQWEVERLVQLGAPTKLLFLLPANPDHYQPFREWVNKVLPVPLDEDVPDGRLLMFDEQWVPTVLPPKRSLKLSMEPFLRQNDITLKDSFLEAFLEHNGLRS